MVEKIYREHESARRAEAFLPYIKRFRPGDPGPEPGPPTPAPDLPPAPPRDDGPATGERYNDIIRKYYQDETQRKFEHMKRKAEGFGGITLGNTVKPGPGVDRKPVSLTCLARPDGTADLVVTFDDNSEKTLAGVLAEDAYVAYRMVCVPAEGVPAWKPEDGIGIVGMRGVYRTVDPDRKQTRIVYAVTLHPALVDRRLGYAALMLDATPGDGHQKLYEEVEKSLGADARAEVERSLESRHKRINGRNMQFLDVPLEISCEGSRLMFHRQDDRSGQFPEETRASAFLELHVETGDSSSYDQELADELYSLMPILTRASYSFSRVNRFVPVLALYRWVKSEPAAQIAAVKEPRVERVVTPEALAVMPYAWNEFLGDAIEPVKLAEMKKFAEFSPRSQAVLEQMSGDPVLAPWIARIGEVRDDAERRINRIYDEDRSDEKRFRRAITDFRQWEAEALGKVLRSIPDRETRGRVICWIELNNQRRARG
jgi:hypothetical protein